MANQLEMFYSSFSGTDTRSNKLLQDPKAFRKGSKNFRYNFQDEIQNRQGFQYKNLNSFNFVDIFEYKYRDPDTGQTKTQLLGVDYLGRLNVKRNHYLVFTSFATTYASLYYNDVISNWQLDIKDANKVVLGSVVIDTSMTLDDGTANSLKSKINALIGLTSVTCNILDNDGNILSGTSTLKAYLLDAMNDVDTSKVKNPVYYWDGVVFPVAGDVPFPVTKNYANDPNYSGISYVNLNNCIYMSDGGFPMKYDGKSIYRVGVPAIRQILEGVAILGTSGVAVSSSATVNTPLPTGVYSYKMQFGFKDFNGATYLGLPTEYSSQVSINGTPLSLAGEIGNVGYNFGKDFPLFGCKVLSYNALTKTITTNGAHNVYPGMCIAQQCWNNSSAAKTSGNLSHVFYAKVLSVTSNTIVLAQVDSIYSTFNDPAVGQVYNAYYVPADKENAIETSANQGEAPYGCFMRIYRTKIGQSATGPWYFVQDMPLPLVASGYTIIDNKPDTALFLNIDDMESGQEIPRACKYISQWQGQLVQGGRPVDPSVRDSFYPSIAQAPPSTWIYKNEVRYTEALLCDYQTVFWTDALTPEGFPQDARYSITVDTKFADEITGIAPNKEAFFIFKTRSTAVMTGTAALIGDQFLEVLESDAGCSSHRSIQDVMGTLIWLDGVNGFYACVAGRFPENIGWPIQDYQKINTLGLDYTKAVAANFRKESLYICSTGGVTFVFDYADNGPGKRNCWYIWDNLSIKGLTATSNNELLFSDATRIWKMKLTNSKYDYADHTSAISMVLNTSWLTQGHPTIDKHYVGLWISSIQGDFVLTVKQYGNFLEELIGTQTNVDFIEESSSKKFVKAQVKASLPKLSGISWGMENSQINKWVRIQGYELQYSADFNPGEPKR